MNKHAHAKGPGKLRRPNSETDLNRFCKDCVREWSANDNDPALFPAKRDAPHPGPRCVTHHRIAVKERKAAAHEKAVQRTYGLNEGEYQQLYEYQGGRCALCKRATGATRRLSVDHDHSTGLVRGLVCRPCNDMLGHGRDSVIFFRDVIAYLFYPPAKRLGIERRGKVADDE